MIVLKIKNNAGPGNQMFMYARAYALARKYNQKIVIVSEISGYSVRQNILQYLCLDKNIVKGFVRLDWTKNQYVFRLFRKLIFDVILKIPFLIQITQSASESRVILETPHIKRNRIYVLDGYWECHEYFDEYRADLIEQFKPNYDLPIEVQNMVQRVENKDSVAIHIRKGDFLDFNRLIKDDYYDNALNRIKEKNDCKSVYILTEDDEEALKWKKKYAADRIWFNTPHKYLDEWYVMSKCKYHIIANSTYSWWSSYLADIKEKVVIFPSMEEYLMAEKDNNEIMYKNYYVRG